MAYRVQLPPGMSDSQTPGQLSYPPKTGDSGDSGDESAPGFVYFTAPPMVESVRPKTGQSDPSRGETAPRATGGSSEWNYETRWSDPYWQAAMDAWRRIAGHACLPGAVRWLEKHQPALYRELMEELPGEIDRLWDSGVPIPRFQAVLNCWVEAHQKAVDLYSVRRRGKLVKNGEPCKGRGEL